MEQIGTKIRALRKKQKLTLAQLSARTGIQIATLSRIETNKMTGTLESHLAIAKALGVELTDLYSEIAAAPSSNTTHRTADRPGETFSFNEKAAYEILTNNVLRKKMLPSLVRVDPGGRTSSEQNRNGAEKFIFVLSGRVTVYIEKASFRLEERQSLYFDASLKHYYQNDGDETARFISVQTPVEL
ncbi:MAG: helix-turn-helix domain-containing protein [Candidatus Omnitrophota bacterium]